MEIDEANRCRNFSKFYLFFILKINRGKKEKNKENLHTTLLVTFLNFIIVISFFRDLKRVSVSRKRPSDGSNHEWPVQKQVVVAFLREWASGGKRPVNLLTCVPRNRLTYICAALHQCQVEMSFLYFGNSFLLFFSFYYQECPSTNVFDDSAQRYTFQSI